MCEKEVYDFIYKTLEQVQLCDIKNIEKYDINSLDVNFVKKIMSKQIISYSDMKALLCVFQTVFNQVNTTSDKLPKLDIRINKYLKVTAELQTDSVNGIIFYLDALTNDNRIVLKRVKEVYGLSEASIRKEYITGIKSINPLRALTPCFALTLGGFSCTGLLNELRYARLCSPDKKGLNTFYLLMENVQGYSLFDTLINKDMNSTKFIGLLTNLFMSLEIAQRQCCFTHFDLHAKNVIVKNISKDVSYKLIDETVVYTIRAKEQLPVIIDFGYSFSVVNGFTLGEIGITEAIGCFMVPAYDIYRLLISCVECFAISKNNELLNIAFNLFSVFSDDTYDFYNVYEKYKRLSNKANISYAETSNIILPVIRDRYSKILISNAHLTPLMFVKQMQKMYPELTSQYITQTKRVSELHLISNTSAQIYCDSFKCKKDDATYKTLKSCLTSEPSYLLNFYNSYLTLRFLVHTNNSVISELLNEQIKFMKKNNHKLLKYDEILFNQYIKVDVNKIVSKLPLMEKILKLKMYKDPSYEKVVREQCASLFPVIKEAHDELLLLNKYLDIYYTIIEIKCTHYKEYDVFMKDMKRLIDTIDQNKLDMVRIVHRWSLALSQYYRI